MHQEHQREKQMADLRREITSEFQAIGKELENQMAIQLWEFEQQVYGEIDKEIATARHQEETAIAASNYWVKRLVDVRKDFEEILRDVTEATNTVTMLTSGQEIADVRKMEDMLCRKSITCKSKLNLSHM